MSIESFLAALHTNPLHLGLALAGITVLLLALRLLDGRAVPFSFRLLVLFALIPLSLLAVAGYCTPHAPLVVALVAVGSLFGSEVVYFVFYYFNVGTLPSDLSTLWLGITKGRAAVAAQQAAQQAAKRDKFLVTSYTPLKNT